MKIEFTYNIVSLGELLQKGYIILENIQKVKLADIKTGKSIQLLREGTPGLYFLDVESLPLAVVGLVVEQEIETGDTNVTS